VWEPQGKQNWEERIMGHKGFKTLLIVAATGVTVLGGTATATAAPAVPRIQASATPSPVQAPSAPNGAEWG
jgi:hypothetical protein